MILKKLSVKCDEAISVGDSVLDKQMSDNGNVSFMAAVWDSEDIDKLKGCICLTTPSEIMNVTI